MSLLEKDLRAKKISEAEMARRAREEKHEQLKAMIADHKLEFTYIRNYGDADPELGEAQEPDQYGGAVVCWKMPSRPNARMLEVSIAWCHDLEKFDKVLGRFEAASNYISGKRTTFKLMPGEACISAKLKDIFENGFMV